MDSRKALVFLLLAFGCIVCGHAQVIVPDSVYLGMKLGDFKKMYMVDTMCASAPDKNKYTYVQTSDNLYARQNIVSHCSYLVFINGHLVHCLTVIRDSTSAASLKTSVAGNRKYKCANRDSGGCFAYRSKSRRKINGVSFGHNSANIDFHDSGLKHYRVPFNPLIFDVQSEGEKMFPQSTDTVFTARINALVEYLDSSSYARLFFYGHDTKADSVWRADTTGAVLKAIIQSTVINTRAQFLAAEILMQHSNWKPEGSLRTKVAEIYATALKENYAVVGNPWGVPDDIGDTGRRIARLGDAVVIAFRPLLKCNTRLFYAGSKKGTAGRYRKYRVKDVAASHICNIMGIEFDGDCRPWKRNVQIRKLKRKLRRAG